MSSSKDGGPAPKKQKIDRQNSIPTSTNLLNQGNSVQSTHSINKSESEECLPIFFKEISDMMRGFGDCQRPLKESVILVEKILLQQMRGILQEVVQLAVNRTNKPEPRLRDFQFLMRKSPTRLYRLHHYLISLHRIRQMQDNRNGIPSNYRLELESNDDEDLRDIVIAEQIYDEEKVRRFFRADRISQILQGAEYKEYTEARRTSLGSQNLRNKLRSWLNPTSDTIISNQVYVILAYLAHETIATIVDYSILTRLNSANRQTDPFNRFTTSSKFFNVLAITNNMSRCTLFFWGFSVTFLPLKTVTEFVAND